MRVKINEEIFDTFPVLESERLLFRAYERGDAEDFFQMRTNTEVMKYMDSPRYQSVQDAEKKINGNRQAFVEKQGIKWVIALKSDGNVVGDFGFWRIDKENCRAEIGYALLREYWGMGYMSEAMDVLLKYGFGQMNIHSVEANVNPENKASIKLLKRFGFRKEAYFRENYFFDGEFLDSLIFSLLERDFIEN